MYPGHKSRKGLEDGVSGSRCVSVLAVLQISGVTACSEAISPTRDLLPGETAGIAAEAPKPLSLDVRQVRVLVPETLVVSEANPFCPGGDIVWREDPAGDRHAQVRTVVANALQRGAMRCPRARCP